MHKNQAVYSARWYQKNRAAYLRKCKEYNRKHRKEQNAYKKEWRKRNYAKMREYEWRSHGIKCGFGEYQQMYRNQRGACAICKMPHKVLQLDHNAATGEVRGLLCGPCNRLVVSAVEHYPKLIAKAFKYLRR